MCGGYRGITRVHVQVRGVGPWTSELLGQDGQGDIVIVLVDLSVIIFLIVMEINNSRMDHDSVHRTSKFHVSVVEIIEAKCLPR